MFNCVEIGVSFNNSVIQKTLVNNNTKNMWKIIIMQENKLKVRMIDFLFKQKLSSLKIVIKFIVLLKFSNILEVFK